MSYRYSKEQLEFIKQGFKKMGIPELTVEFNQRYGEEKTPAQIRSTIKNHKFTCGRKKGALKAGRFELVTQAQADWIRKEYENRSRKELTNQFNARFGTTLTAQQITSFVKNHKIKSGRDGRYKPGQKSWNAGTKGLVMPNSGNFQKGVAPINHRPVGSERVNIDGYLEVKISEPNKWAHKHRVVYAAIFGPIPEGQMVRFRDGNPLNCHPDNLFLVDRREHALLNKRYHLNQQPTDHRETLVTLARLEVKAARLSKGIPGPGSC